MTPANFKKARHALGLSVAQMARALSDPDGDGTPVNPRTVRRWEAGSQDIPGPAVVAIYSILRNHSRTPRASSLI